MGSCHGAALVMPQHRSPEDVSPSPETHVSSPGPAPSPDAGLPWAEGTAPCSGCLQHLTEGSTRWCSPGMAPIWTPMKGKGHFDPCLTLMSGQGGAKLKTEPVMGTSKGSACRDGLCPASAERPGGSRCPPVHVGPHRDDPGCLALSHTSASSFLQDGSYLGQHQARSLARLSPL